jgi:hypothetical protein
MSNGHQSKNAQNLDKNAVINTEVVESIHKTIDIIANLRNLASG